MIGPIVRICLFLSSYIPLFAILGIKYWGIQRWVTYTAAVFSLLGVIGLLGLWLWIRDTRGTSLKVTSVERQDQELLAYLITYLFPFLQLQLGDPRSTAIAAILFLTVGLLYVSSSMLHVNPTLAFFGIHIYEVESTGGKTHTILTRADRLIPGKELEAISLANRLHWGR